MSYNSLKFRTGGGRPITVVSLMGKRGLNLRDLPQLLSPEYAIGIQNYLVTSDGGLEKRRGLERLFNVGGAVGMTMLEKANDDVYIFGYGTTVSSYTISTGVVAVIKNDFLAGSVFSGARYGDFFFVCNGLERIWRITVATGAIAQIATAPVTTSVVKAIGARLYAGFGNSVQYCTIDDGTNPPFDTWTTGTVATNGGIVSYRNGGSVNDIESLGEAIVVFQENGKFAFKTDQFDSGGTISKADITIMARQDFGGARGVLSTKEGLLYANEAGLWQMVAVGQQNIPFSDQEFQTTLLLSSGYFDDLGLGNASIQYDGDKRTCFLTCARDSATNNFVLAYNFEHKAFSEIIGWTINRFMKDGNTIYGASSTTARVYECFAGSDDDDANIGTLFEQELKVGDLATRQKAHIFYIQGFLSPSSSIVVNFDIYDINGVPVNVKRQFTWTTQYNLNGFDGYNSARYSGSAYGGDEDFANLIESFDSCKPNIRNFHRIRVRIISSDRLLHVINWMSLTAEPKVKIRRRRMTQVV